MAREVIGEWNALHALEQKRILLPLPGGDADGADLLVAIFCAAKGTPDASTSPGIAQAIEKELDLGRPVLIYFSEGRADLKGINLAEVRVLEDFKKRFESRAALDSFGDEKEFRAKFARQLDLTVTSHAHFRAGLSAPAESAALAPVSIPAIAPHDPSIAELSIEARALLSEACDDPEAYIGRMKDASGLKLQANGRQFVPQGDAAAAVLWEKAFEELIAHGLIRDAGCKGRLFQISTKGFEYLKGIGKAPVGYIAELGGM